eukprot:TRINITY_DN3764_c0_g2_i3.p1 TRINITY_DN3764_c0_g2~~TRINITY_DN3764_c0_g2_i3.p1  ORF type:complete len:672 (-),score=212.95 TRINITY_DN3764_c0_g2_i3:101-1816(-)
MVRRMSVERHEEAPLATPGHTIHYDGLADQGRDVMSTATLLPKGQKLSQGLNVVERDSGLKKIFGLMDGVMQGKTMIVCFFCLGPLASSFTVFALQITDSFYVAHSELILYRNGYQDFFDRRPSNFMYFMHSAGELDERHTSKNANKRLVYIDPVEERVFTINNQYAGNSLACKKLALRLAIYRANHADWLAEHMFLSGYSPMKGGRITYMAGAYPSACGKTATAMITGSSIVGDDIIYTKVGPAGEMRAVNVERGMFGIIRDVNNVDDPQIFKALMAPREVIFSNVLIHEGKPFWSGCGMKIPKEGFNHVGHWKDTMKDSAGRHIPPSHPNSRFTLALETLDNVDPHLHDPAGVHVQAVLYGGRDSNDTVPIAQTFNWEHGVFVGATIESETTAATIGKVGVRTASPFSNMDFMIVPLSVYIKNHFRFGRTLKQQPKVFSTNYFLRNAQGKFTNTKLDKRVWVLWAEGRVHGEFGGRRTPIGIIPLYEDLRDLFTQIFPGRVYTEAEYDEQFSIRAKNLLSKYERSRQMYATEEGMPHEFYAVLYGIIAQLNDVRAKHGDVIPPTAFPLA